MGFNIVIQDEFGVQLDEASDPKNILDRLFPEPRNKLYPMLGSIDPYADTFFNGMQMDWVLGELKDVSAKAQTDEEIDLVAKIEAMAQRVRDTAHLYLKFIGD